MKKIVIIGASGHWGYAVEGIKKSGDCFSALAPGNGEELESAEQAFDSLIGQGIPFFKDYRKMLDEVKPHIAVINPHFYLNGPITIECLRRGIHCFVEKPLSFYNDELEIILGLVKEKRLRLATMMEYRYHPPFFAAFEAVQKGLIGLPIHITAQKSYKSGIKPQWMHSRDHFGGLISWVGSHSLDWINWISDNGVLDLKACETRIGNHGNGEMESASLILMALANGGQASANIDYLRPQGAATHEDDRLRIAGTTGVVEVLENRTTLIDDKGKRVLPLEEKISMFGEFLKYVDDESYPYRQSLEDIYALTKLCIKAQDGADKGNL